MRERWLLGVFTLVVLLPGVFGVSLVDRDEGWYAQVSREMLAGGDWVVPRYLGEPWIGKPPLLYWLVAGTWCVIGVNTGVARLVSVIAMVGAVQLLATLANDFHGRRAAWFASIAFITAMLPAVAGKLLITDALLLLWILACAVCLWRLATREVTLTRSLVFWTCLGLGLLTKGPAVVLFVGALGVALVWRLDDRQWLRRPVLWLPSLVCVALAAPWYVLVAQRAGGTFSRQFVLTEILSRFVSSPYGQVGPPGYYLILSLGLLLPWSPLLIGAVVEAWRERRDNLSSAVLLSWCGLAWIVLELMISKMPHYILPCCVPLSIMFGRMWDRGLEREVTPPQRAALKIWVGVMMTLGGGIILAACWRLPEPWALAVTGVGTVWIVGFALVAWYVRQLRLRSVWRAAVATVGVFHILVGAWLLPTLEPYRLSRVIAERVNGVATHETPVLVCGYEEPTLFFYLAAPARKVSIEEITSTLSDPSATSILVVRDESLRDASLLPGEPQVNWTRVIGFNYVKFRRETVWVVEWGIFGDNAFFCVPHGQPRLSCTAQEHGHPAGGQLSGWAYRGRTRPRRSAFEW